MATGEVVTLINRTSRPLNVKFDGKVRVLQPGPNAITAEWVRFAKLQNPRMGSFLAGTLEGDYLVGVEGVDDCSMIDPTTEPAAIEMYARPEGTVDNLSTGERDPRRMNAGEFAGQGTAAEFNGRNR